MYTKKTIDSIIAKMTEVIKMYREIPVNTLKVSVSNGNKKIGRVKNVSLPAMISCGKVCKGTCDGLCYDLKAMLMYPSAVKARCKNWSILIRDREQYFAQIAKTLSKRVRHKYFRWHVAGDIIDVDYFDHMVDIAVKYPDWTFWTYTKQYHIVNAWLASHNGKLPSNLTVMFSEWRGVEMHNPYGLPEFKVVFKGEQPPKGFYCPGNCDICKAGHCGCIGGQTTYCHEH